MVEKLLGHWKLESSDNFDEYMKAMIHSGVRGNEQADRLACAAPLGGELIYDKADVVKALWDQVDFADKQTEYSYLERLIQQEVNLVLRKVGNSITSYFEITKDSDTWTIHITSTFKNQTLVFKIGETIDEKTLDGRQCKSVFTIEGNVLVQQQDPINSSDVASRFEYEVLEDGKLHLTCVSIPTNVVAKRTFQRYTP